MRRMILPLALCLALSLAPAPAWAAQASDTADAASEAAVPAEEDTPAEAASQQEDALPLEVAPAPAEELSCAPAPQQEATDEHAPEATPADEEAALPEAADDADALPADPTEPEPAAELQPAADDDAAEEVGERAVSIAAGTSGLVVSSAESEDSQQARLAKTTTTLADYWRRVDYGDGSCAFQSTTDDTWLSPDSVKKGGRVGFSKGDPFHWFAQSRSDGLYALLADLGKKLYLSYGASSKAGALMTLAQASGADAAQGFTLTEHEHLTEALTDGERLPEGPVTLESVSRTGKVLEVRKSSKSNSANIGTYLPSGDLNQKFVLVHEGSGLYTIRNARSGKVMDISRASTESGANVAQYTASHKLHQLWYFVKDGDSYALRSAKSGLALAVSDTGNAFVQTPANTSAQRFKVAATCLLEDDAVYRFSPSYATTMNVYVKGNATASGTNVELAGTNYYLGQYWRAVVAEDGSFSLVSLRGSNKLAASVKHKGNVEAKGTATQWVAVSNEDGSISIAPKANQGIVWDIPRASTASGANLWLYSVGADGPSKAQRFEVTLEKTLTAAAAAGKPVATEVYQVLLTSATDKAFDIQRGSTGNSAAVLLYTKGSKLNQKFRLTYQNNGLYVIQAANSGKYLELKGGKVEAGTAVQQYSANSKLHQYWYLVKDGAGYQIVNAKAGLALSQKAGGTAIVLAGASTKADAKRFTIKAAQLVDDGTYGIAASACNPLVLDISKASKASGANVAMYIANGKANQQFTFKRQSDGTYTIQNKNSGRFLEVKDASTANGANIQQGTNAAKSAQRWEVGISPNGGLTFKNAKTGKYLEFKGGAIRLSTNVQQTSSNKTMAQSFVTVKAGYNPKVAKIGWQNPEGTPQVSRYTVALPAYANKSPHNYVSPATIRVDATREECIEVFIGRAYQYLNAGSSYVEPWAKAPGGGIDCSGLVLQCLYATGMDLEHAAGTEKVGGYNPYNHATVPAQTYNSARWYENKTFTPVSTAAMKRGDLVYYGYRDENGSTVITHVAIYLGNGQIIHSTNYNGSGNKVRTDSVYIWNPIGAQRPFV